MQSEGNKLVCNPELLRVSTLIHLSDEPMNFHHFVEIRELLSGKIWQKQSLQVAVPGLTFLCSAGQTSQVPKRFSSLMLPLSPV